MILLYHGAFQLGEKCSSESRESSEHREERRRRLPVIRFQRAIASLFRIVDRAMLQRRN